MLSWVCRQCGEGLEAPESARNEWFECPKCGIQNCPANYFDKQTVSDPYLSDPIPDEPSARGAEQAKQIVDQVSSDVNAPMPPLTLTIVTGVVFVIAGAITVLIALTMERTAGYSDTLNLGRLNDQIVYALIGCSLFVCGSLMLTMCACVYAARRVFGIEIAK